MVSMRDLDERCIAGRRALGMLNEWCRVCGGEIQRDGRCIECGTNSEDGRGVLFGQNPAMAQSNREKQADYRARMALLGLKEVRGVFLPKSLHPVIKEQAAKLLEKHKPEEKK